MADFTPGAASGILALKVTLTPLLIAAASLVQRRWGGLVGGLVAGLPLTSAPVSVFLAVEHGPAFAARAATSTLLGVIAMSAFCVAYAKASDRWSWGPSAATGVAACVAITLAVSRAPQDLPFAALASFPALAALVVLMGRPAGGHASRFAAPWWDMPARMAVATAMVLLITGAASLLGPKWSGLLSTLPVYALVMGAFSHRHGGAGAARVFLRGVAVGALGAAMFLVVVAAFVERLSLLVTYLVASLASIGLAAASHALLASRDRR